jgi:O-antigen ligase
VNRAPDSRDRRGDFLRVAVLALLAAAPLAFGAVHTAAWAPLLVAACVLGALSWLRARRGEAGEGKRRPGARELLALHGLVLLQLIPLPPRVLALLSPGSFSFYNDNLILPLTAWRPVSVSPPDTLRGLAFLFGMSCLYAVVVREFHAVRWRRRLAGTLVAVAFLMTLVALVQSAAGTRRIYGLFQPTWDWAVFGPYVNRNHFAGYMVLAIPLSLAFAAEALESLRRAWRRRRIGWLALGEAEGTAAIRRSAEAMVLVVGLLASQSRGGLMAFVASTASFLLSFRRRLALAVIVVVALLGMAWIGVGGLVRGFETRGIRASRFVLWADALRMAPRFPLLGAGLNGFGAAFPAYQTRRLEWYGEAHNEYLQALLDTGIIGASVVGSLLLLLFRRAFVLGSRSPFDLGVFGSLSALAFHNTVEFNWQIPANAATFFALSALALRRFEKSERPTSGLDPSSRRP